MQSWKEPVNSMARKLPPGKSLAEVNPELSKEWHPTKNGELSPNDITLGSNKKVWWKCPKGNDHEWETTIKSRTRGSDCRICSGRKVVDSNSLKTLNPELAKEWHPTKNGALTSSDVSIGNNKVWWKCPEGIDHEWQAAVYNRNIGQGCPVCSGNKLVLSNSIAVTHKELASQWSIVKNGHLSPRDVSKGSEQKVWWKCDKGDDHEWEASPNGRIHGDAISGCPVCRGLLVVDSNSLETLNPELSKEWHPTKNGDLKPSGFSLGSNKIVWWKCDKGIDHEWETNIYNRNKGNGCPVCSGRKIVDSNSLETLLPVLAKEWDSTKNGDLKPSNVGLGSDKNIWWKCDVGLDHIWQAKIRDRQKGSGCGICSGYLIVKSNCLNTTSPKLSKEWHPTNNGGLTPSDVHEGSHKKVWWKCKKGEDHEWQAVIKSRKERGCPYCTLTPQSKQELTITFELKKFFEIDPKGFKTRVNGKLWRMDIYLSELHLGIEFDGSYWHKDKRALDKLKTEQLKDEGFQIMRIREEPLKAITDIDVISKVPFNAKHVTDEILKHILDAYTLKKEKIDLIKLYLRKKTIQNEQGLEDYIDQILTEKADRKKNK